MEKQNFKLRTCISDNQYFFNAIDFCRMAKISYPYNLEILLSPDEILTDSVGNVYLSAAGITGIIPKMAKYKSARSIAVSLIESFHEQTLMKSN